MVQVFEEFLDGVRCVGFRKQFLYMQRIYYESTRNLTIQLWYSKQAVFSRFGGIWPLWKTSATEYLKYSTDIEGERRQSFDTPCRSTRFVFCNFLDRKFEWAMRYPSKISITLVKPMVVLIRNKNWSVMKWYICSKHPQWEYDAILTFQISAVDWFLQICYRISYLL